MPNTDEEKAGGATFAFFSIARFEDGKAIRGAMLVTDENSKPLEFRCTAPLRPSKLQSILYGGALDKHMYVDLIGVPLLKGIKENATHVVVNDSVLLGMRPSVEIPVVLVQRDAALDVSDGEDGPSVLDAPGGRYDPVIVSVHPDHEHERQECREAIGKLFGKCDICEPFERIALALEEVHNQRDE